MTHKTQNKAVKNEQKTAVKCSKVSDNTKTLTKEETALNEFFKGLKDAVTKTAQELGIASEKPNDYHLVYCYTDESGALKFKCSDIKTNINPYAPKGMGIRVLTLDLEKENHINNVVIINVIKLGK